MLKFKTCCVRNKSLNFLRWILSVWLMSASYSGSAQNDAEKGLPFVTNYPPKSYNANPVNWSIIEDNDGMMYFGQNKNKSNLLQYDGVTWKPIGCPATSAVVRCLSKDKNGTIFYGGLGDFGYLDKDSAGATYEHSLLQFVPKEKRSFFDVWTVLITDQGIYFQTRDRIFRLTKAGSGGVPAWKVKTWEPA